MPGWRRRRRRRWQATGDAVDAPITDRQWYMQSTARSDTHATYIGHFDCHVCCGDCRAPMMMPSVADRSLLSTANAAVGVGCRDRPWSSWLLVVASATVSWSSSAARDFRYDGGMRGMSVVKSSRTAVVRFMPTLRLRNYWSRFQSV